MLPVAQSWALLPLDQSSSSEDAYWSRDPQLIIKWYNSQAQPDERESEGGQAWGNGSRISMTSSGTWSPCCTSVKFCRSDFPFLLLAGTPNYLISHPTLTFSEWMFFGLELYYNSQGTGLLWIVAFLWCTPISFYFPLLTLSSSSGMQWSRHASVMRANILVGANPHRSSVYGLGDRAWCERPAWLK